ncbi:TadE family protein [Collimonas humicola]|uniref:TadE family protein n=1 Tax=Collimonas humicola TaxID=2825886 RepID=UPI001B8C10A6|nr:TadE family protein [Collimonas humicola]
MIARSSNRYRLLFLQKGAATVEFYVVSFFVFIPMVMAVLQMGLFFVAKNTVNMATLAAARAGAATGGDKMTMRNTFAKAIVPLYIDSTKEITTGNYASVMLPAYAKAGADILLFSSITTLNPTAKSFADFGIPKPGGGGRIIPTTNLDTYKTGVGSSSKQTRAEALLLKIEVRYCYELKMPIVDKLVTSVLMGLGSSAQDNLCFAANRIPIKAQAVVRMTEPPQAGNF